MTDKEFRKVAVNGGYATLKNIDAYIQRENKETYTENDLVSVFRFNEARKKDHKTKMRDLGDGSRTTKTYVSMRGNSSIHADMGD